MVRPGRMITAHRIQVLLQRNLVYAAMTGGKPVAVTIAGVKENRRPWWHPLIYLINR